MADRLEALHRRIDDLTDPNGDFAVVCPLSGKRPVPVRGKSFPSPDDAETAVDLVRKYRTVLREVDPHLENIPFGVVEETANPLRLDFDGDGSGEGASASGRARTRSGSNRRSRSYSRSRFHSRRNGTTARENEPSRGRDHQPPRSITLSGDGDREWLRMDHAPVVTVREDGEPLDDAVVARQLNAEL
jgi:hypothetical protein